MATSWTILNLSFFMPLPVDLNGTGQRSMNPQPPHGRPPISPYPDHMVEAKRPRLYPSI
jgi:hypothetical protein